jgi:uncharacterized protein (TIGR02147 family)
MPDLYSNYDYRRYLKDFDAEKKSKDPNFSHRYFSMKVGYPSAGFFSDVVGGKKNLTGAVLLKVAKALKLRKEEEEYFISLVEFNQAKTVEEKNRHFERMAAMAKPKVKLLEARQYEYFKHWYYAALREVISFYPFRGDYPGLAKMLAPPIKPAEARKGIKLLLDLGMIRKEADGAYRPTEALLGTGRPLSSLDVANFQLSTLGLAQSALDRFPPAERDFSTLTLPLDPEDLPRAKSAIRTLRAYLLALSEKSKKANRVFQFNFQVFPLTRALE